MSLKSVNKIETNKYELIVTVGAEEFEAAVEKAFRRNIGKINVPGFRKGKATRRMVEKLYGETVFYEDAVNDSYPEFYEKAVAEAKIVPVDRADTEILSVGKEGYEFKATVITKPECKIDNYTGIVVDKFVQKVSDKDIDEEIEKLRNRGARVVDVTDRTAVKDDIATIDFEGFMDGTAFNGGKAEKFHLTLGSNQFIPGFEDQVIGHKPGEDFDVNVTFPEDYHVDDLKGKPAVFKVKMLELKAREYPVVDDEFAKDVSEFDTLAELRADTAKHLQEGFDNAAQQEVETKLIETISENLKAEIPDVMFEHQIDEIAGDFERRLNSQGLKLDTYLKYTNSDAKAFRDGFREQAERQVKMRLALETIAAQEKLTASEEEINAEYDKLAAAYGLPVEDIKKYLRAEDVASDIAANKAIDLVRNSAVITEKDAADKPAEKPAAKKPAAKKTSAKAADGEAKPAAKKTTAAKTASKAADGEAKPAAKKTATAKTTAKAADGEAKPAVKKTSSASKAKKTEDK